VKKKQAEKSIFCVEKELPEADRATAAKAAIDVFPANAPRGVRDPQKILVLASKFWGARARDLTVGFLERPSRGFIDKLLLFANSWGGFSNVRFRYTSSLADAVVRVSTGRGGYWSYLGTDCLQIPRNRPTMNLEGFTLNTRESEWHRVVKHEFGHALGCPHEHMRAEVIELLDREKTINYFVRTQGWSRQDVIEQIFVPLERDGGLMNPSPADVASIMCYQFPGSVTKSGRPIPGGSDFSEADRAYFGKTYPRETAPPPDGEGKIAVLVAYDEAGQELMRFRP